VRNRLKRKEKVAFLAKNSGKLSKQWSRPRNELMPRNGIRPAKNPAPKNPQVDLAALNPAPTLYGPRDHAKSTWPCSRSCSQDLQGPVSALPRILAALPPD